MQNFIIIDEGTLDHVFECSECGEVMRFSGDLDKEDAIELCSECHECDEVV